MHHILDREEALHQTILFKLGNETYGLPISAVKEIIKPLPVTKVPRTAEYVEGIIDLRGLILPIINLRILLGLAPAEMTDDSRFIHVVAEGQDLGIMVDMVSEVVHIPQSLLEEAPEVIAGVDGRYLDGVARLQDRLILLVNLSQLYAQLKR